MFKTTGTLSGCNIDWPDTTAINNFPDSYTTTWFTPILVAPEIKVLKIKRNILFYY